MADVKYERDTNRFDLAGLDLNRPVDSIKPGKYPYAKNIRSYQAGRIEPRYGITPIAAVVAGQSPVHSVRRLNDPAAATYARIIGTGTHLAYGTTSFTDADSGYSGDPLALQPWKPRDSPTPYMYVADRSRMRKITAAGVLDTIGYAAPNEVPGVALGVPLYKALDDIEYANNGAIQAAYAVGGANPPALATVISRTPGGAAGSTTTIAQIIYDTGSAGWASINLTSMIGVGYGERLTFDPAGTPEVATVQEVLPASVATTIGTIIYDSGTSGLASIVLATPISQVNVNAIIRNTTVPENARIVGVTYGPDGNASIRVSTSGTWAAGNSVSILSTLRVYVTGTYAAAAVVKNDAGTAAFVSGIGTLTRTVALDLSLFSTGNPTQPTDYMCIGLRTDRPDLITEIKVLLDVDSATNDFTRNFYYRAIRPSDLTPSVRNLQALTSTNAQIIQRQLLDNTSLTVGQTKDLEGLSQQPDPTGEVTTQPNDPNVQSQQLETGDVQWTGVRFRLADLIRVGTDDTRSLRDVAAIRIQVTATGAVNLAFDSWWIGGGYGPDSGDTTATPYYYRYRVRNPATNVASNFSPATRLMVEPFRQQVVITPTQYAAPTTSIAATSLVLDIARFGGELADWHYIGTIPNSASPTFTDKFADDIAGGNPIQGNDNYQMWPVKGKPVSGTTGSIAGTSVNDSATTFNTSWAMGTRILIDGVPYTIYRVISTSRLELVENAGSSTGKVWRIDEPTLLAQPLPCLWEWDGTFFACGDTSAAEVVGSNPGRLYYSNPDSETTVEDNYMDLTSPSEPLMNGLQYNIRSYVFSSESFIQILKTGNPENPYKHEHIPNGKGMFSRWLLTREPCPMIFFGSKDGIYVTTGGEPASMTDEDLSPLFPIEGNMGSAVNGIPAPNLVVAQATHLRLSYYDEFLYFDYVDTAGGTDTLVGVIDGESMNWLWDVYTPNVVMHYGEEGAGVHSLLAGTGDTFLYQYGGALDNVTSFSMELTTPSRDQGEPRANKLYGDIMVDMDLGGRTVTATPFFNNNASSTTAISLTNASRGLITIPLANAWQTFRNISLNLVVAINSTVRPLYYIWEPRWTFESAPIAALAWEISPTSFGIDNFKHFGMCKITHVSTVPLDLIFTVDGTAQTAIPIAASGGVYKQTIFRVPVMKGKIFKLRLASHDGITDFRFDTRDSFFEVKGWGSDNPYQRMKIFADYSVVEG